MTKKIRSMIPERSRILKTRITKYATSMSEPRFALMNHNKLKW